MANIEGYDIEDTPEKRAALLLAEIVLALQLHEIDIDDRAAVEHFLGGDRSPEFIDAVIVEAKSDRAERWFGADPLDGEPPRKQ
jgi:hypothetical protein